MRRHPRRLVRDDAQPAAAPIEGAEGARKAVSAGAHGVLTRGEGRGGAVVGEPAPRKKQVPPPHDAPAPRAGQCLGFISPAMTPSTGRQGGTCAPAPWGSSSRRTRGRICMPAGTSRMSFARLDASCTAHLLITDETASLTTLSQRSAILFALGSTPPPSCTSSRTSTSRQAAGPRSASKPTALLARPASSSRCTPGLRASRAPTSLSSSGVDSTERPDYPAPGYAPALCASRHIPCGLRPPDS